MRKILGVFLLINLVTVYASDIAIKDGVDYTTITPNASYVLQTSSKKVNVTEFYSYACIHCALMEPLIDSWYKKNAKKVELNRIQVVWDGHFVNYAKINATAELLHLDTRFNQAVFKATIEQKQNLEDAQQLQSFLVANKAIVNPKIFMDGYNSFTVTSKSSQYAQYTSAYNITGTPTFIVGGKYATLPAKPEKLIQVIQALVVKVANEQKAKNNK